MDSSKIKVIAIAILAVFVAIYLGISAATAQLETFGWVLGSLTFVTCLALDRRIWLLIPFMAALEISLRLPGMPSSLLLAQVLVLGFSSILFLMRKLPFVVRFSELEILMLVLIVMVVQAYLRNPVGTSLIGTDTVGGKTYILFAITCASSFLLCFLRVPQSQLALVFRLSVIGGLLNFVINIVGQIVPIIGYYTGASYENLTSGPSTGNAVTDTAAAGRAGFLTIIARNLALWISSVISPVAAMFRPLWALLILGTLAGSALSGFRSASALVITTFLLGTIYRGGRGHVVLGLFGAAAALTLLALANVVHPLPPNVQRALTFLPGTWEERYKLDAAGSTDWRTEIWKDALLTDRWIKNKFLGDGLGFSAAELQAQMNAKDGRLSGISGFDSQRENILANGDYHSTAVSAVRTCGYAGLTVLLVAMFRLSVHAHRLIRRCRGTPWYGLALFLGIPPMVALINVPISAANFLQIASAMFLSLSLIRLAENNLDLSTPAGHPPQKAS
jgi:hypothetical protein